MLILSTRVSRLGQIVIQSRINYDIWWFLVGSEHRPKVKSIYENHSEFFRFDYHAHFVSLIMHLSMMYDPREKTISLPVMLKDPEVVEAICPDVLASHQLKIEEFRVVIRGITIIRSNLFAHRTAKKSYDSIFELAKITPDNLRDLTNISLEISNSIAEIYKLPPNVFNPYPRKHLEELIQRATNSPPI